MGMSGRTMVAWDDCDADEEGIWGAYSSKVTNDRLLGFIFTTRVWLLVISFARLLRNCDVGPANFFRICQARGNRRHRWWIFAIV